MFDAEEWRWIGRGLGLVAYVCITYDLFIMSEGGEGGGILLLGLGIAGAAVLCFIKAKPPVV